MHHRRAVVHGCSRRILKPEYCVPAIGWPPRNVTPCSFAIGKHAAQTVRFVPQQSSTTGCEPMCGAMLAEPLDGRLRVERDEHEVARGDVVLRELGVHRAAHDGEIKHAAAAVPGEHASRPLRDRPWQRSRRSGPDQRCRPSFRDHLTDAAHLFGEVVVDLRAQGLRAVAQGVHGVVVHLDDEAVRAAGRCGERHRRARGGQCRSRGSGRR